jgi:hypothetical protein
LSAVTRGVTNDAPDVAAHLFVLKQAVRRAADARRQLPDPRGKSPLGNRVVVLAPLREKIRTGLMVSRRCETETQEIKDAEHRRK